MMPRKTIEVILARGRFWFSLAAQDQSQKSLESDAKKKFEEARKENFEKARKDFIARELAPKEPEVYLQQASAAMYKGESGYDDARRILKDGLENIPTGCDLQLMSSLNNQSDIPEKRVRI